jgi:hypothetical protein
VKAAISVDESLGSETALIVGLDFGAKFFGGPKKILSARDPDVRPEKRC